jgi:hypothetical protein
MEAKPIIKVKLSLEIYEFLDMNGTAVFIDNRKYLQPAGFWYKKTNVPNVYEVYEEDPRITSKQLNKQ